MANLHRDVSKEFWHIILLCILWYGSSLCQNVLNKHLFAFFPYPTTVSMGHMLASAILLEPVLRIWKVSQPESIDRRHLVIVILPLAFGKFFSSVSAQFSILKVSVSFAHTVKATMPIFTVFLSRAILGEKQTTKIYLSLLPIIVGVMITTFTELNFDSSGLIASVVATVTFALQNVYSKKALRDIGIHHLRLLVMLAQLGSLMLLPIWFFVDFTRIVGDTQLMSSDLWSQILTLLFLSSFFNFCQNIFAFSVLNLVAPLSYSIANASKRIVVIFLSLMMLRNPVTPANIMGMLLAVFGVVSYNLAKYESSKSRRRDYLPMVASDLVDGRLISHEKENGHVLHQV